MKIIEDKPNVIFLDYFEKLEDAGTSIRRVSAKLKSKPIIISSNYDITALVVMFSGFKIIYFEDLLARQDYEFMDQYVFNLTQAWYTELKSIEGITDYNGINFGLLLEEKVQRFFSLAIKTLEIALKINDRFHPQQIIFIGNKDIFKNLSIFIKERLAIETVFIEARKRKNFIGEMVGKIYRYTSRLLTNIIDSLMRIIFIKHIRNNGILIDARLYSQFIDLNRELHFYLYLIENGLKIRLMLLRDKKVLFAPILTDKFFKIPNIFDPFYRYWKFINSDAEFNNKFIYKKLAIWKLLQGFIKELIIYDYPRLKYNIAFFLRIYKILKPKTIVLREGVLEPERTIVLSAKQSGIPTLVIQHGILAARNVYTKLLVDKIAVWGKAGSDWYGSYGNDISKCIVTGRLEHDLIYSKINFYRDESKKFFLKIGADPNIETILYIANFFKDLKYQLSVYESQDFEYRSLKAILNVAKYFPDKQMIIKMHPFDLMKLGELVNQIPRYPNIFVIKDIDISTVIANSSLVLVSRFSSATIDAIIFDKPVITLNFYKRDDLIPFAQRGVALSVTESEHLPQIVSQIFQDKTIRDGLASNRESFLYDYAYKIDGQSKKRITELIRRLVNEQPYFFKINDLKGENLTGFATKENLKTN